MAPVRPESVPGVPRGSRVRRLRSGGGEVAAKAGPSKRTFVSRHEPLLRPSPNHLSSMPNPRSTPHGCR
jgi:hypothetical protein